MAGMTEKPKQMWCRPTLRDFCVLFAGMIVGAFLLHLFYGQLMAIVVEYRPIIEPTLPRVAAATSVAGFCVVLRRISRHTL